MGVDIGSSAVKVVSLKPTSEESYELEALAIEPLPSDAIVDGVIISKVPVADAIERVFREQSIRSNRVATSISGHSVIVKKISLPAQDEAELDEAIQWEAEQYIPFERSEVNLDYQVLSRSGDSKVEVLLVAAKRDKIADQTGVLSMAGKIPLVVDVDGFALQNAYEMNYLPQSRRLTALLNIGASLMNVSILRGTELLFVRDISVGGRQCTESLQKEFKISFEEAEKYKTGECPNPEASARTEQVLASVSEALALEVHKTFDYCRTTLRTQEVEEIYLSGGASRTRGLKEHLEKRLRIPVYAFNPFKRVRPGNPNYSAQMLEELGPRFAVAVGLALRSAVER